MVGSVSTQTMLPKQIGRHPVAAVEDFGLTQTSLTHSQPVSVSLAGLPRGVSHTRK